MTKLSVNINKLATLRNSRGKNNPDIVKGALDIMRFGGQGITVHPRPDERHIRRSDVYALKQALHCVELNIEGYPSDDFLKMVREVGAAQCTLVPDPPEALTSNAGWDVKAGRVILEKATKLLGPQIRTSVFIDPATTAQQDYQLLAKIGVARVELYTERYAETYGQPEANQVLSTYLKSAELAQAAGLGVNAGHDLSTENLGRLIEEIPWIDEVSIGHALICDALYWGLEATIARYLKCIADGTDASKRLKR